MPEAGFPNSHTTETHPQGEVTRIFMDVGVIKSLFGYIKIGEIAFDLLGFICVVSATDLYNSRGPFFNFVSMMGFWYSAIVLALYVFHLPERVKKIPSKKIEFVFCCIETLLFLIASSLCANHNYIEAYVAASFFGFCAMVLYAADAWFAFTQIKGIVVVTTTTTTNETSPTTHY